MKNYNRKTRGYPKELLTDGHLTDGALLFALDDELSPRHSAIVKSHLHSCWSCRTRQEKMERLIGSIVDCQNAVSALHPPSAGDRRIFLARLDSAAAEPDRHFSIKRLAGQLTNYLLPAPGKQLFWAGALLLFSVAGLIFYQFRTPHVVSAKEFLNLAAASELSEMPVAPNRVVIRKIRIQVDGRVINGTAYRDVTNKRNAIREESSDGDALGAEVARLHPYFDLNSMLDVNAYSRWRASLPGADDAVDRVGGNLLRLATSAPSGPIAEGSLTVRASDFHAVKESLRLRDNTQIDVAEETWAVAAMDSIPFGIFETAYPNSSKASSAPAGGPPAPLVSGGNPLPDDAELADSEVEAEVVLHSLGADLNEQIEISVKSNRVVSIEGIVEDESRKQQLTAALQGIPDTELSILTVEEAAAQQKGETPTSSRVPSPVKFAASAPPLLDSQLNTRFPDKDQRVQFVDQTLSLTRSVSGRAWALTRLADRYPQQKLASLNEIERGKLVTLLTDHISALREDSSALENQLGQVLSLSSNTSAANAPPPTLPRFDGSSKSKDSDNWRDHVRCINSSVNVIDESTWALLASSPGNSDEKTDVIELNLRTALNGLQAELQITDRQVQEAFSAHRETTR